MEEVEKKHLDGKGQALKEWESMEDRERLIIQTIKETIGWKCMRRMEKQERL